MHRFLGLSLLDVVVLAYAVSVLLLLVAAAFVMKLSEVLSGHGCRRSTTAAEGGMDPPQRPS